MLEMVEGWGGGGGREEKRSGKQVRRNHVMPTKLTFQGHEMWRQAK